MIMRLICLLVMVPLIALGQTDWNITGAGARAEGFGGAFIGVADDATAIVWNPAGLGQLERVEATAVVRYIMSKIEYQNSQRPELNSSFDQSHFAFNFASVSVPLRAGRITIVPAVAYQKQLDFYGKIQIKAADPTSPENYLYESSGGVQTITPGVGFKLHPMFFVGVVANIWTGKAEQNEEYPWQVGSTTYNYKMTTNSTYSGFNFGAGVLVDFEGLKKTPIPVKLGASFKSPFDLKREGDVKQEFLNTTQQINETFEQTIEMPYMLGFGSSFRVGENLTLAADYEIRAYGNKKIKGKVDTVQVPDVNLSDSQQNLNQFRVGAEYLFVLDFGVVPLRAGFRTNPTVLANEDDTGKFTDQVVGKAFSVGTGFIGQVIAVDLAYTRLWYDRQIGAPVTIKTVTNTFSGSVIIYF